jgi:quercetin dioxygenase-like cupin family protein
MKLIADAQQEPAVTIAPGLQRQVLAYGGGLMMTRFSFAAGAAAEWHSHPHEQVSCVVEGKVDYFTEGAEPVRLLAGASFYVPPNLRHRVVAVASSVLIDVFTPQRDEFIRKE